MEFTSGVKVALKELAWHLLSNLQSSDQDIVAMINNYRVWTHMMEQYHTSRFTVK